MNQEIPEGLEAELRRLRPAEPPPELLARLAAVPREAGLARGAASKSVLEPIPAGAEGDRPWRQESSESYRENLSVLRLFLRRLVPAGAAILVCGMLWQWSRPAAPSAAKPGPDSQASALQANDVQIDRQLVACFDAVAKMPTGEPIRFRCREWADKVVWRDSGRGLVVEERHPRLEVVPVSFETY